MIKTDLHFMKFKRSMRITLLLVLITLGVNVRAQFRIPGVLVIHTKATDGYFQVCMNRNCLRDAKVKNRNTRRGNRGKAVKRKRQQARYKVQRKKINKRDIIEVISNFEQQKIKS